MKKKKITYEQMLDLLKTKQYTAPDNWEQLEGSLTIQDGLSQLPTYKAPDNLWEGIEAGLDNSAPVQQPRNLNGLYIFLASILFLISTVILVKHFSSDDQTSLFQYKSEVEMASLQENKMMLDDNIEEVLQYIEYNSFMFSQDQLDEFNTQLTDINTALTKLLEMQETYGSDESSTKLMAKMERDKANLLRSMITSS